VVDGQGSHAAGRHGLHFDAGFVVAAAGCRDRDAVRAVVSQEVDAGKTERQTMAQRYQFGAALCVQDTRYAGRVEHFDLCVLLSGQQRIVVRTHADTAYGNRRALRVLRAANFDHTDLARFVKMAENGRFGGGRAHCVLYTLSKNNSSAIYAIQVVSSASLTS